MRADVTDDLFFFIDSLNKSNSSTQILLVRMKVDGVLYLSQQIFSAKINTCRMPTTPIPLYRQGNATSPRMDNVRPDKDVVTFLNEGVIWVLTTLTDSTLPGGISTFANQGRGKNWWKLDSGIDIPIELKLVNDHNSHWLWQPSKVMPIEEYKSALRQVGELFYKIN